EASSVGRSTVGSVASGEGETSGVASSTGGCSSATGVASSVCAETLIGAAVINGVANSTKAMSHAKPTDPRRRIEPSPNQPTWPPTQFYLLIRHSAGVCFILLTRAGRVNSLIRYVLQC